MCFQYALTVSVAVTIISLNGVLGVLVNLKDQIPGLLPTETCGDPHVMAAPAEAPVTEELPLRRFALPPLVATPYRKTLDFFCAPTQDGIIMTGILLFFALATSYIALFIELELPLMAAASLAALFTIAGSAIVLKTRYERYGRKTWFAFGKPAGPAPVASAPAAPVPVPVPRPESPPGDAEAASRPASDEPGDDELEWYWVAEPFSYVKIKKAPSHGYVYTVYEPPVTALEKTILQETYAHLRDIIVYDTTDADQQEKFTDEKIHGIIREFDPVITTPRLDILTYYLKRDLSGYGPLEVLMRDPALEDLSCNGWDLPVFIFHKVYGSLPSSVVFGETELNQFVLKLAQKANKQISLSNPMVDATLPDGARVQITYSDVVSTKGSSFTIRKFRADPMTPIDLIRLGTYSPKTLAFVWLAIEHHKSLLVVGGTASGKTSTMNAVSIFIPQNAKIVSLEDTREIQLPHKNWLPTQTRELNTEGLKGDIDLFALLKACMRQRPEYIIVGEVRGREAQTLFQAMNTGHATLSTIHAGTVQEAVNRLTHDPINVPAVMFQALDLVVFK
jgi:flagellar protein FlaI